MNMVEVKTAELSGAALDWAVFCAVYQGCEPTINVVAEETVKPIKFPRAVYLTYSGAYGAEIHWSPSTDWSQGGPLIHKYGCDLNCIAPANCWEANCWDERSPNPDLHLQEAETPLIAACRAIVSAKLGDVAQVPAELVQEARS